jgi:transmembrane sensor
LPEHASPPGGAERGAHRCAHGRRLHAEAAVWVVRIDAGRASRASERLAAWCARSPAHRQAFELALDQWQRADALGQRNRQAAAQAQRTADPDAGSRPAPTRAVRKPRRSRFGFPTAAAGAFALVAAIAVIATRVVFAPDYSTSTGELRTLALDDGSTVRLDADSAIDIRYSAAARRVTLLRGRAAFEVRHGDARPFIVAAGNGSVEDIGTAFQVERSAHGARVAVAVTAGSVLIRNAHGSAKASAGDSAEYADGARGPRFTHVDIGAATAWQRARLVFNDAPLSDVADALNRYYRGHYVFVRDSAAGIRVSGNFDIHAPAQAVDTLAETLRLRTTRIAGRIIVIDRAAAS